MSLAPIEPTAATLPAPTGVGPVTLRDELAIWQEAFEFAKAIAPTDFVPRAMRNNPPAVMACIIKGHELGVSALHSLSSVHIIEGRPTLAAELQRALVLAQGHEIWTEDYTISRVILCGRRRDGDHVQKVTWTIDDAKRAGLAGKDNWRKYPRDMLLARASGTLARLMFADVIAGMSYNREEIEDMLATGEIEPEDGPAPAALPAAPRTRSTRRVRRGAAPTPAAAASDPQDPPTSGPGGPPPPPLPGEDGYDEAASEPDAKPEAAEVETPPAPRSRTRKAAPPADEATTSGEPAELVAKRAQAIAIQARDADVDHHDIVRFVTAGRYESAKDLNAAEADAALHALADIRAGRAHLEVEEDDDGRHVDLVDGPGTSKAEELNGRVESIRRQQRDRARGGQTSLDDQPQQEDPDT